MRKRLEQYADAPSGDVEEIVDDMGEVGDQELEAGASISGGVTYRTTAASTEQMRAREVLGELLE